MTRENSVDIIPQEGNYTYECSFLDNGNVEKHDVYLERNVRRELFKSANAILINADVNGSFNILKGVFQDAFSNRLEGLRVNAESSKIFELSEMPTFKEVY